MLGGPDCLDDSQTFVAAMAEAEFKPIRNAVNNHLNYSERTMFPKTNCNRGYKSASPAHHRCRLSATLDSVLPELIEVDSMFGRSAAPPQSVEYKSPFIVLLSYWKASKLISPKKSKGVGGNLSSWVLFNYPGSEGCWIITDITHTHTGLPSHFLRGLSCCGRARRCAFTRRFDNSVVLMLLSRGQTIHVARGFHVAGIPIWLWLQ